MSDQIIRGKTLIDPSVPYVSDGSYIDTVVEKFITITAKFETDLDAAIGALGEGDSSSPKKLAEYQKALMKYTLHMNSQSALIKGIKDMDGTVLHNAN
jgi:type III secretion apparatus needle protein